MNAKLENALYAPLGLLFHAIALLPMRVLYVVSDVLRWVACDVLRYRRPLVDQNIAAAFPELTAKEQRKIVRREDANDVNYHLIMNHSLLEDTIVFTATGISALLLVSVRLALAVALVWTRRALMSVSRMA